MMDAVPSRDKQQMEKQTCSLNFLFIQTSDKCTSSLMDAEDECRNNTDKRKRLAYYKLEE
jgi:hypothetical protein